MILRVFIFVAFVVNLVFMILNFVGTYKIMKAAIGNTITIKKAIELDSDLIQKALDYLSENGIEGDITYDTSMNHKWIYLRDGSIYYTYIIELTPELFGYGKKWKHIKDELDLFIENVLPKLKLKEINEKNDKD